MESKDGNGKNIKIIYGIIFILAFTYASVIYAWVDIKLKDKVSLSAYQEMVQNYKETLKEKASVSDYQRILQLQDETIKELQKCNTRLTRIETILEGK